MPIKVLIKPPDYGSRDLYHRSRYMCPVCGLVFDFEFDPEGPGWPEFEPDLDEFDEWQDDDGQYHVEEPDRVEICPRCTTHFDQSPLIPVLVRATFTLEDFVSESDAEGLTLEFKQDFASDRIRQTIAAFAATQGGRIIVGIDNHGARIGYQGTEDITTVEGKDAFQRRVEGVASGISPRPEVKIQFVQDSQAHPYVVIVVPKGPLPLYSIQGRFYTRDGPVSRPMQPEEAVAAVQSRSENHTSRPTIPGAS